MMKIDIDFEAVEGLVLRTKDLFANEDKKKEVTLKGRADFVTQVDFAVQNFLQSELEKLYPEIGFLGEEGEKEKQDWSKAYWILDPVDGTTNLIHDFRMSVVSLALWDGQDLAYGCIYNPYSNELCTAIRGQGMKLNGVPVFVSQTKSCSDSLFSVGTSPYEKNEYGELIFEKMKKVFMAGLDVRRTGSAAWDICTVALGRIDGYFEYFLKPWDCAAGMILVEEAGGRVSAFDGHRPNPGEYPDIVATNGQIHEELLKLLQGGTEDGI